MAHYLDLFYSKGPPMKTKQPTLIFVLSIVFLLGCQFLTQPLAGGGVPTATEPPVTQTPEPSPTPEDPFAPFSGLLLNVYNSETYSNAVWQLDENESPRHLLANHYFEMLSPDKTQVVYSDYPWGPRESPPCLWLADVNAGNPTSLACSSGMEGDLLPSILGWDPTQPNTVLAIVNQTGGGMGGSEGYFGTISLADGSTTVLDPDHPIDGEAVISPDGTMVAYGSGIYYLDSGYQEFDPSVYGIDKAFHAENPSWSPDGKKIAWGLVTEIGADPVQASLGIFDLEQKTATLILPSFAPKQILEILEVATPYSFWSPDGQRLAINVETEANDASIQDGWKIVSEDGKTIRELDGEFGAWSPDGQWVSYTNWAKDGDGFALFVSRADGSETFELGDVGRSLNAVRWSKNGRTLVFVGNDQKIRFVKTGVWQVSEFNLELENPDGQLEISLIDWAVLIAPWEQ